MIFKYKISEFHSNFGILRSLSLLKFTSCTAISTFCAFAAASFLFNSLFDVFEFNDTLFDVRSRWHDVLFHSFINNHSNWSLIHSWSGNNAIVFDVPSNELKFLEITFYMYFIECGCISSVVKWFIPETSPEERNFRSRCFLSKHVQSSNRSLIDWAVDMFKACSLTSVMVRIISNITCSEDIWVTSLQENISFKSTLSIFFKFFTNKLCIWNDTSTY